jgi:hypothetical protein
VRFQNYGGVAVMVSAGARLIKMVPVFEPATFEYLCVRATSGGATCIIALLYRPGSEKIPASFFDKFTQLLGCLSSFVAPYVVTGDLNIRLDRTSHPWSVRFNDLLASFEAVQLVDERTHNGGGNLDVVITRADLRLPSVTVTDPGLSDHRLVTWLFGFEAPTEPLYETRER